MGTTAAAAGELTPRLVGVRAAAASGCAHRDETAAAAAEVLAVSDAATATELAADASAAS